MKTRLAGIYGITSADFGMTHEESARAFLEGGVKILQYREKHAATRTMIEEAVRIKALCAKHSATFIVDDRIDVAAAVDADGVHLGQDDAPIGIARRLLPGKIIGISAKTPDQAAEAEINGADYLGVGTIFPTSTKVKTMLIGIEGFSRVRKSVKIPVFAIGGLKLEHLKKLKEEGADGIAVITAILGAAVPADAAKAFVEEWNALK